MTPRRALVAATVIAATLLPAASANAASGASVGDLPDVVSGLATDAARLLDEERALIGPAGRLGTGAEQARERLHTVDSQGNALLRQFDRLGIALSPSVRAALAMLPEPPAGPIGRSQLPPLIPQPAVYTAALADLGRIAATPEAVVPAQQGDGQPSFSLLVVAAGALLALGLASHSNTARRTEEELEAMAWSDGLTGVANRRRLDRDLNMAASSTCGPTSVIMVDVDHFKLVNDAHGHQIGDDVLRRIGAMLASQVRSQDLVYRYGGEEFCVLLLEATTDDARVIADRVVDAARRITLPDDTHVTVSVGVAAGDPMAVIDILEAADRALFEAKTQGRDRVLTADQLQPA